MKKAAKFAFVKTIPILLGYLFLGIAFGLLLQKAGLGALWAFLISAWYMQVPCSSPWWEY